MKELPVFTISLDFELYWGVFDKVALAERQQYFRNTRDAIPQLLELFAQEKVHVTWATVGMLFAQDWEEWQELVPQEKPTYKNPRLCAYTQIELNGQPKLQPCFFAPELVKQVAATPHQELATHTFCHYYCKEEGQTISQFRSDLQAAKQVAARLHKPMRSLVFPRNQYNEEYLKVCFEEGITSVRSNPGDWFWENTVEDKLLNKVFRTGDGYFPLGQRTSFPLASLSKVQDLPLSIPASRFLRPVGSKLFLNKLRLKRILKEMTEAAKRNECYHLWWHPHNFGDYPEQSMSDLRVIINHYKKLQEAYGMVSMTMQEIQEYVEEGKLV